MAKMSSIVFLFVCVNAFCIIMNNIGVTPAPSYSAPEGTFFTINPETIILAACSALLTIAGNNLLTFIAVAWTALTVFVPTLRGIVLGFPDLLTSVGVPTEISTPFYILCIIGLITVIWLVSFRKFQTPNSKISK